MGQSASLGWMAAILLVALVLRVPGLSERPMHADEAIQADRLGTLLEHGRAPYDPSDYHGTVLLYASLPAAWAAGITDYKGLTETTLRAVPVAAGLALVLLSAWIGQLAGGRSSALLAAGFTAVSPGLVYFSRYYIPEQLLVLFSAAALAGLLLLMRNDVEPGEPRQTGRLLVSAAVGVCAGLMFATKETAVLAFTAAGIAMLVARLRLDLREWLTMGATAVAVSALALTPGGFGEAVMSMLAYGQRAFETGPHLHPWHYYFEALVRSGDAILLLPAVGLMLSAQPRSRAALLLRTNAAVLTLLYCVIPYKTPWCALGFLHAWILFAALQIPQWLDARRTVMRGAALLAAAGAVALGAQSWRLSVPHAADPRNPYVYGHTLPDVYAVVQEIRTLTERGDATAMVPVQVFTTQNLWPLPWYFRHREDFTWLRTVPEDLVLEQVLLLTPELEEQVAAQIYRRVPGEAGEAQAGRLYMPLFPRPLWLRPAVEVRGYAALALLESR